MYPAEPYRIKTVEPIRRLSVNQRRQILEKAAYNVFCIPQEAVFLDFGHFRGLHAMSDIQWAGMLQGDEAYAGSRNFFHVLERIQEIFGKSWGAPLHRGRGGLNLLAHGFLQKANLSTGPLTEVERFHFTRFHTNLYPIPWEISPEGTVRIHLEGWSPPEDGYLYWRLVSPTTGYLPTHLRDLQTLLHQAKQHNLKTFLNVSSALLAYRTQMESLKNLLDQADVVLWNAREDGLVHTGALVMGDNEEDYLTFRTYVVVFEGLHTYGGLAGRDMEALARGLDEARQGIFFHHHQEVLHTLRKELQRRDFPLAPYQGIWGVEITTPDLAPALRPETAVHTLQAALYLISGIRIGRRDKNLWIALPLRRYTAEHLSTLVESLEALRDYTPLLPDLELLNRPQHFFDEEARFAPARPFLPHFQKEVVQISPPPYRIKHVEITVPKSREKRERAIQEAGYNTFLLRSEDVYIDLLTDSGTSAESSDQWAALMQTAQSLNASAAFDTFREAVEEILGIPYVVPTHQGRAAEHILSQTLIRPGQYVLNNMYFTTTREHQERAGGIFVDLIVPEAHDPTHPHPFKGDMDLEAVVNFIEEKGPERIAYICLEMNVNMAGGQPVSLKNTRKLAEIAHSYDIPLIFDATRCAENAYMIQQREEGQQHRSVREILKELMGYADGLTFSAKKDPLANIGGFAALRDERLWRRMIRWMRFFEGETYNGGLAARDLMAMAVGLREMVQDSYIRSRVEQTQRLGSALQDAGIPLVVPIGGHAVYLDARRFLPHLEQKVFPAQRLAAEIYVESGVRTMERGTVSAGRNPRTGDHRYPKLELVRITLPRRVYTASHMNVVVEGILRVWERRERIPGLRMVYEPPTLRFFTARFESL